ncbi:MAG: hypothetical protein ACI9KD_003416, partial [Congregibacter sp.]
ALVEAPLKLAPPVQGRWQHYFGSFSKNRLF